MSRERVYDLLGMREQQTADLQTLQTLTDQLSGEPAAAATQRATVARRWSNFYEVTGDYVSAAAAARTALEQAQLAQDVTGEAEGYLLWGRALWRHAAMQEALQRLRQSLELARLADLKQIPGQCLRAIGALYFHQDYSGREIYQEALGLYAPLGDRRARAARNNLGDIALPAGQLCLCARLLEQSIRNSREIGERWSENVALGNLALVSHNLGDEQTTLAYGQEALQLAQEIGYRSMIAYAFSLLGHALAGLGRYDEAERHYQQALVLRREMGELPQACEALAGLARLALARGNLPQALAHVEEILQYLQANTLDGADEPFLVYLTCCQVLQAADDERYASLLERAHHLLQTQAAHISDPRMRRSFLHNVAAHAQIVQEWEAH
jgi:tetratricopeptide (TPR) repeat protein